jgi:hypothetical protein
LAVFVGFGAYMYGDLEARSTNQAGVGKYVVPELDAAQPKHQAGGSSQSTKNSSSGTEAPDQTLSAETTLPILTDSEPIEPKTGSAVPTETPSLGDTIMTSKASAQPLPIQAAGISTPVDSCTSQVWCANPPQQLPHPDTLTTQDASSCKADNGEDPCSKEKNKKKTKEKPSSNRHSRDKS